MIPKWEPRARMGLYIRRSPFHAANVALIFNPRTGHVSLQFHVIFDDDFRTVPYLRTASIPPYWADLVRASSKLHVYTERKVDTWQSLPEHIPENGDFTSEQTEVPMGTHTNDAASLGSEGASMASIPSHKPVLRVVTFQDQNALRNGNPQPNEWQMPESVDLHSSGLQRSSRLAALHSSETIAAHSTSSKTIEPSSKFPSETIEPHSTSSKTIGSNSKFQRETIKTHSPSSKTIGSSSKPIKRGFLKAACLALFSSICADGTTTVLVEPYQTIAKPKPSLLTTAVNSFHRVNTLYDGMVNCFSTLAHSSEASNETFTYTQALQEPDYHDFIKAMVHEVEDHESRDHWTCMRRSDMPENTKKVMSIWSFK